MRLLWLLAGFLIGVSVGRNRGDVSTPVFGACVLAALLLALVAFFAGRRHQRGAVAAAVAVAQADAQAQLDAVVASHSSAQATGGHVQFVLAGGDAFPAGELRPVQVARSEPEVAGTASAAVLDAGYWDRLAATRKVGHTAISSDDDPNWTPAAVERASRNVVDGRHAEREHDGEADPWYP